MAKFMGPVAGYGLDAVMKGLTELSFRWGCRKTLRCCDKLGVENSWGERTRKKMRSSTKSWIGVS